MMAHVATQPLAMPSLVIYGGADSEVPPELTRELVGTLESASTTQVYLPEGTHRIPKLSPEHAETVRAFVAAQQRAKYAQ